jgi:hypothetical protein
VSPIVAFPQVTGLRNVIGWRRLMPPIGEFPEVL